MDGAADLSYQPLLIALASTGFIARLYFGELARWGRMVFQDDYPWRCLCLALAEQITRTTPLR